MARRRKLLVLPRPLSLASLPISFYVFTKKRADIIKHLKELKKKGKIWSFASNQNGVISMKVTEKGEKKILTRDWDDGPEVKTYTVEEIDRILS